MKAIIARPLWNVFLLCIAQALGNAGLSLVILTAGLVGASLAPVPALATLPPALYLLGMAGFSIPAGLAMRRFGRKSCFIAGTIIAAFAALLAANAIIDHQFILFCLAVTIMGLNGALVQQYRFAASEYVAVERAGLAISIVLVGGIASGFLGPELARHAGLVIPHSAYAGAYIGLAGCYGLAVLLLTLLNELAPLAIETTTSSRPLRVIIAQPLWIIAILAGGVGYGMMGLLMTGTPLQLTHYEHFSLDQAAFVVQSHFVAMFLPALISGLMIDRLGMIRILVVGMLCMAGAIVVGVAGHALFYYWSGLILLGFGWNLLFIGGTVLLRQTYHPNERFMIQASYDAIIIGAQAATSLSAGFVLANAGWFTLNLMALLYLLPIGVGLLALQNYSRNQVVAIAK